ncbi:DNA-3-methyladenine glycosylase I [Patescibacteria group bacterium]|nr:DNA-3-methyladenine glycosylase I [Patescibacteria group bacterium]MCH8986699.1 DNA-3-methyladenine glycosylase I [Patescibacteria group bacterium]
MKKRCDWPLDNDLMIHYHDTEWGVPLHDDKKLFESFLLDTFQAGLSWSTILNKRKNFRRAFDNFQAKKIARYKAKKISELMKNAGIIRNQLKILSTIDNAKAFLEVQKEFGSFDKYIWKFVGGKPRKNKWKSMGDCPAKTQDSETMSKDLKQWGFRFVGPTICYAFMQGTGMVNDHAVHCFRYNEVS